MNNRVNSSFAAGVMGTPNQPRFKSVEFDGFKVVEFDLFRMNAGLTSFVLSSGKWVEKYSAFANGETPLGEGSSSSLCRTGVKAEQELGTPSKSAFSRFETGAVEMLKKGEVVG